MTQAHIHATLMLQYAQDAAETETPWERWEWRAGNKMPFEACTNHPAWVPVFVYRRKPQTITVNGFEVPAPVKDLGRWIIVAGNPVDGFVFYGPYQERDDAVHDAENGHLNGDWWIAELEPVGALA